MASGNKPTQQHNPTNYLGQASHLIEQFAFAVGGPEKPILLNAPQQRLIDSQAIDPYMHTIQRRQ